MKKRQKKALPDRKGFWILDCDSDASIRTIAHPGCYTGTVMARMLKCRRFWKH
jgi:hypothetical protein